MRGRKSGPGPGTISEFATSVSSAYSFKRAPRRYRARELRNGAKSNFLPIYPATIVSFQFTSRRPITKALAAAFAASSIAPDGFVSAHANEGTLVTKPFTFKGSELVLNILSRGETRAELQDATGNVLPGFALNDCTPITADSIEHVVIWKGGPLSTHSGKPVQLRFVLQDADLFALQFRAQ